MFPILSTQDLPRLLDFYVAALDAELVYRFPPEGQTFFASLDIAGSHLGVGYDQDAVAGDMGQRAALWFYADSCDDACARLLSHGASQVSGPTDMPWGERVADLRDPDGNLVHIGQRIESPAG